MTTAQPGQEQRMELREKIAEEIAPYMPHPGWEGAMDQARRRADDILALPELAARPTADLGEDGELVTNLRKTAQVCRNAGDHISARHADEAADRLILYREALEEAVAALGQVNVRCFDREASPLKPLGDIAREALAGICKKLGDAAYDDIARAVLSRSGN